MRDRWFDFFDGRGPIVVAAMSDADLDRAEQSVKDDANENWSDTDSAGLLDRIAIERIARKVAA